MFFHQVWHCGRERLSFINSNKTQSFPWDIEQGQDQWKQSKGTSEALLPSLPCHGNICPCCVSGFDSRLDLPHSLAGDIWIWGCGVSPKVSPGETRWFTRSALERTGPLNTPALVSWAGWTLGCSRQVWELAIWCGLYYGILALLKCCFSFASKTLLGSWRSGSHPLLKTGILKSRK